MFIPNFCLKFMELGIASTCLILLHYSYDLTDVSTLILCSGTYTGFILVLSGELIGEIVFAPLDVIQDVYLSLLGLALFATCSFLLNASLNDDDRSPRLDDKCVTFASGLAALNALLMFCDSGEMLKSKKQDPFIEVWWTGVGAVLFVLSGARTLEGWRHVPDCPRRARARAAGICALAAACVLIADAIRILCADDDASDTSSYVKEKPKKIKTPCAACIPPVRFAPARLPARKLPEADPCVGMMDVGRSPFAKKVNFSMFPTARRPSKMPFW